LQVVRDISTFRGGESEFRRWIFTVTRNRMIDDHRRRLRRPYDPVDPAAMGQLAAMGDVESEAVELLTRIELLQLLEHLSPDQRDVLTLRLVGDFTVDQIAQVMGRQPGAIKALQHRAVTRLQELVESTVTLSGRSTL